MIEMNSEFDVSSDSLGLFNKITEFVSLDKDRGSAEYNFEKLTPEITNYLKKIIINLESKAEVYLCVRGDSISNYQYEDFIEKKLYDFFIVGSKAKYHVTTPDKTFQHVKLSYNLTEALRELIKLMNEVLEQKHKIHPDDVSGQIPAEFFDRLTKNPEKTQEAWKFVFLGFLHNKGVQYGNYRDDYFKPYSGFVSLTYGEGKYDIAKNFALKNKRKGFIFVYILRKDLPNYFKAETLTNELAKYNVKWYDDIHKEIMVINGLYPHNIVGFFEIEKEKTKRFILNPWFYKQILCDLDNYKPYPYENGVLIDQSDFDKARKRLGYNSCFIRENLSLKEFVVREEEEQFQPIIESEPLDLT